MSWGRLGSIAKIEVVVDGYEAVEDTAGDRAPLLADNIAERD